MAWTAPYTWVNGDIPSASGFNAQLRDNMTQQEASVVTTAADVIYASSANTPARIGASAKAYYGFGVDASNTLGWNRAAPLTVYVSSDFSTQYNNFQQIVPLTLLVDANQIFGFKLHLITANLNTGVTYYPLQLKLTAGSGAAYFGIEDNEQNLYAPINTQIGLKNWGDTAWHVVEIMGIIINNASPQYYTWEGMSMLNTTPSVQVKTGSYWRLWRAA